MNDKINNIATAVEQAMDIPLNEGDVTAWLVLDGKDYELRVFFTEFGQAVDHKGKPQHEVKGGLLSFSLYDLPDDNLNNWMLKPFVRKNGEIQFRMKGSSMPLRIGFSEAQCISYVKNFGFKGLGVETKLVISPKEVSFNEQLHSNEWSF